MLLIPMLIACSVAPTPVEDPVPVALAETVAPDLPVPATAPEPLTLEDWRGDTVTAGASPVTLRVRAASADEWIVTLYWQAFQKTSIEQVVTRSEGCDDPQFAPVRDRIDGTCRHIQARLTDTHPVYDYTEEVTLQCAFGDSNAPAWCKLPYTGWFSIAQEAVGERDVAVLAKEALQLIAREALSKEVIPGEWKGRVAWYHGISHSFHGLEVHGSSPVDPADPKVDFCHGFYYDQTGLLQYITGNPVGGKSWVTDRLIYTADGRPTARLSYTPTELAYIDFVYHHRGEPVYQGRSSPDGLVYHLGVIDP